MPNFMVKNEKNLKKRFEIFAINLIQAVIMIFDKSGALFTNLNSIPFEY